MWDRDLGHIATLSASDQLWLIAFAIEQGRGPEEYVTALRRIAGTLEEWGFWLAQPGPALTQLPAGGLPWGTFQPETQLHTGP